MIFLLQKHQINISQSIDFPIFIPEKLVQTLHWKVVLVKLKPQNVLLTDASTAARFSDIVDTKND